MRLLCIYGPPAAGKLTVARKVAARTGFKVFHNHLSIDCVEPIFEFGTPPFGKLVNLIRHEIIAEAARQEIDLIYTYCYAKDQDDPHVSRIVKLVEASDGEVKFVQLVCSKNELLKRVVSEDRKAFRKAQTIDLMEHLFEAYDLFSPVAAGESLSIDNTSLSPEKAAEQIVAHYRLDLPGVPVDV